MKWLLYSKQEYAEKPTKVYKFKYIPKLSEFFKYILMKCDLNLAATPPVKLKNMLHGKNVPLPMELSSAIYRIPVSKEVKENYDKL